MAECFKNKTTSNKNDKIEITTITLKGIVRNRPQAIKPKFSRQDVNYKTVPSNSKNYITKK